MASASETRHIEGRLDISTRESLHAGDAILYTGTVYTARDAAHARFVAALDRGEILPFDIDGAIIYYAGPAPAQPGQVIGSCGPT